MSSFEYFAAALGLINILLVVRRTVLNYPFGIATVGLYAVIFYQSRLYSAALLQVFFLMSQFYGWWYWRQSQTGLAAVPVRRMAWRGWAIAVASAATGTAILGWAMSRFTDAAAPWWDASAAAASLVAQILLDRRYVENWPIWIAVDILSIGLFASQGLTATAALYAAYLIVSVLGWREWAKAAPVGEPGL